LIIRKN